MIGHTISKLSRQIKKMSYDSDISINCVGVSTLGSSFDRLDRIDVILS